MSGRDSCYLEIDPRPFQAAADQASAQLSQAKAQVTQSQAGLVQAQAQVTSAEANQRKAQLDEEKYSPLAKEQAVTQQELDNAVQTNQAQTAQVGAAKAAIETAKAQIEASQAAVQAAKAALEAAQVNLGFTRITSLIDGTAWLSPCSAGRQSGGRQRPMPSQPYPRSIPSRRTSP